ncbi:ATP-binding protein [Candidatus Venteria ishoeyi]|uniref:Novel STAND NTPase 2 domain-containing protein n=1 Tax=Candidatus Venteria ishoeyi TaxID=1899563 RepID=A0A1H6F307_9GAMM|nr:ATP-binding protein [Candidatus Venteria ishoeyi]SEH04452.1 Uncharacterised protein [Candidatus Venteria ishoeyi]
MSLEQHLSFHPERPCLHSGEHCGRDLLVQHAFDRLATDDVQSFAVIGFSRSGKTSFIHHLCQPEILTQYLGNRAEEFIFVTLDAGQIKLDGEAAFFQHFYAELKAKTGMEGLHGSNDFRQINAWLNTHNKRLVCVFDDFNLIVSHPAFRVQFYENLRAWFYNENRVGCILTSPVQLLQLSMSKELAGSPFFNIFNTYVLAPLQLTEATLLLESRLPKVLQIRSRDIFTLIEEVGTMPYLLQRAGAQWVTQYQKQGDTTFSHALEAVYQACLPYYEALYASLKTRQLQLLTGLLQGQTQNQDNDLVARGIIGEENAQITLHQFERFLRERLGLRRKNSGILHRIWQRLFQTGKNR